MSRKTLILWGYMLASFGLTPQQALAGKKAIELIQAHTEWPDARLLDIGVRVFGPGFPETPEAIGAAKSDGVFTELRRSEARYFPYQLMKTLQSSGFWGLVRVVPDYHIVDVAVSATILTSTGTDLKLKVVVQDARGKVWLKEKYKQRADYSKFYRDETRCDPFQSLYNRIVNDILKVYVKFDEDDIANIARIRTISRLRFAAQLFPDALGDYLSMNKKGRYQIERLPATDDPMMARVDSVRLRDQMFVDTFQGYYADFHARMREHYDEFRERSFGRQLLAKGLGRNGLLETLVGAGIVAAGIAAASAIDDRDDSDYGARDAAADVVMEMAIEVGGFVIEDGTSKLGKAREHGRALRELGESIDRGVTPVLVKFEGEISRLTGSMEAQYSDWREILRQILTTETGLSLEPVLSIAPGAIISRRMASMLKQEPKKQ